MTTEINPNAMNVVVTTHFRPDEAGEPTPSNQWDTTIGALVAAEAKAGRGHDPQVIMEAILVKGEYTFDPDDGEGSFCIVTYADLTASERASWRVKAIGSARLLLIGYHDQAETVAKFRGPSPSVNRCIAAIRAVPDLITARDALAALLRHPALAGVEDELINGARAAVAASITPGEGNK